MGNQDLPVNKIVNGILDPAAYYASGIPADATTNTATAVTIPASSIYCGGYSGLGILGNYLGTFQGVVENTTPAAFTYGTAPSRSDLYELQPGSGPGIYRGYFELGTDGSMTFTAGYYPSPNLSIATNSGNANISFQSSWGWTYSLYYTNAAGLSSPVSTWPVLSTTIVGDGNVDQFQMPVSGTTMFYAVSVQ